MLWKRGADSQADFFERLGRVIGAEGSVIATHRSKSITLPVVQWTRPDLGLTLVARDNFYNYKLSVSCDHEIDDPSFPALFHTTPPPDPEYTGNPLSSVYFEGFPSAMVYGYQSQNRRAWSAEIHGSHAMWTVVFLCVKTAGGIPDLAWSSR